MASDQQWANFFTGKYSMFVDGNLVDPAQLTFRPRGGGTLTVTIQSTLWRDVGNFYFRLITGSVPGRSKVPGGHMWGNLEHGSYGQKEFLFQIWELVQTPGGAWDVGFDPTGNSVAIRFQSIQGLNSIQLNAAWQKKRPDTNYPWNL